MTEQKYEIEAHSVTWTFILTRMLERHKPTNGDQVTVQVMDNGVAVYYIDKSFVTAEEIAQAIGTTASKVMDAPKIVLKRLKGEEGWPEPNVNYVGRA